jgi:hypothetical protein
MEKCLRFPEKIEKNIFVYYFVITFLVKRGKMNGIELFETIKKVSSFEELLLSEKNPSKRGKMFEIVANIIIRFGFCSAFTNDKYDHYEGNINTCKLKKVDDLKQYLKKLTSSKSGSSDITLQDKITGEYIFISCKFCNDDSNNNIKYYEVQDIHSAILKNNHKYKKYKIYLFVNNKEKVQHIINSIEETNKHLKDDIADIIGLDDLELCFQNLKQSIQNVTFDEVNDKFYNTKASLELRFHQDLITYQMLEKIDEGEKELLLGAKARSGKTYCVGGLFVKYYDKYNTLNALIITPAPTETLSQFTDDLFHKFRDFVGINIVEIKKGSEFSSMTLQANNIIIVSKQLLDDYVLDKKINAIKDLNLDSIVFDENHFHGTTQMSKNILQSYSSSKTFKLYLTATYAKPLKEWNIPNDCQFYWDIEDEQMCKSRNVVGLIEKHGKDVLLFIKPENQERLLSVYDKMPDLHIITNMMDRKRYEMIKERIKDTSYGFSNGTLLSTTKDGNNFNYIEEVDNMLKYISGKGKIDEVEDPIRDKKSIFERIKYISNSKNSRTKLNNGDFTSQLWFLPFGKDMLIDKVSKCLKDRMLKNRVLSHYEIMIVNSKKDFKLKDIKEEIKNKELKAKEEGKAGLILLAGNQLTLGITLPFVDIVFLFNDVLSSDKILQMMYRCMTETINNSDTFKMNNGVKKIGFVVDLNISRVLNTMLDYNVYKKDLNIEQKMEYLVENNLINIDVDLFDNKPNKSKLIEKLLHIWKSDPINNLKTLLRKIEENVIDLESTDQKLMNQYFTSSIGDEKVNVKVQFDDESDESLQSGKEIKKKEKDDGDNSSVADKDNEDEEKDIQNISLTKDVLPFIIPLNVILTMSDKKYDVLEMIDAIKNNPSLLEIFNNQCFIWWNKKDIIKLIEKIVGKYVKKNSSIYNIAIQFKMSLQSLIDKPKELLELIDSCLKPKQKEKQENGEVFTPMELVFEMLDNLDKHYINENGKSIFTEKKFKWGDIVGSGMGNFSVAVYLRLMEGLKQEIPNDDDRKEHILEKMIYMAELNKKNVFICRQIFDVNNYYCLNLYEGDALELDPDVEWSVEKFDVILGNPPFNKGGIRSHTGKQLGEKNETIWTKFVEKSLGLLKPNGYLAFIHPLSWLKKSHSLHNEMIDRHIIWLKLWDNSQSKGIINADIPISLYIMKNIKNTDKKTTEITSILKRRNLKTTSVEYIDKKYSIPLAYHSIFNKLITFIESKKLQLEYGTKTIKSSGTKTKIPSNYTLEDMWAIDTYTIKEGIMVKKAIEIHPDANKRKLIIANKASFNGAFIDDGKISLTGNHKFYVVGDNLELLKKMLDFNIINIIGHYTKYGQDFLDNEAFKYLPDIRKLGINDIAEDDFYNLIGLTRQEMNQIKKPSNESEEEEEEIEIKPKKVVKKSKNIKPKNIINLT